MIVVQAIRPDREETGPMDQDDLYSLPNWEFCYEIEDLII